MAKNKKEKTVQQQANKLGRIKFGLNIAEFLSFFAPFITIALVNKDKYFIEYDGTKTTWGFIFAMIVLGVGLLGLMNSKINTENNKYLLFIIKWIIFAAAFSYLGQIITDLAVIMWYGLIGIGASYLLDLGAKKADKEQKRKLANIQKAKDNKEIAKAETEIK